MKKKFFKSRIFTSGPGIALFCVAAIFLILSVILTMILIFACLTDRQQLILSILNDISLAVVFGYVFYIVGIYSEFESERKKRLSEENKRKSEISYVAKRIDKIMNLTDSLFDEFIKADGRKFSIYCKAFFVETQANRGNMWESFVSNEQFFNKSEEILVRSISLYENLSVFFPILSEKSLSNKHNNCSHSSLLDITDDIYEKTKMLLYIVQHADSASVKQAENFYELLSEIEKVVNAARENKLDEK